MTSFLQVVSLPKWVSYSNGPETSCFLRWYRNKLSLGLVGVHYSAELLAVLESSIIVRLIPGWRLAQVFGNARWAGNIANIPRN
jgi:hypothetical protein